MAKQKLRQPEAGQKQMVPKPAIQSLLQNIPPEFRKQAESLLISAHNRGFSDELKKQLVSGFANILSFYDEHPDLASNVLKLYVSVFSDERLSAELTGKLLGHIASDDLEDTALSLHFLERMLSRKGFNHAFLDARNLDLLHKIVRHENFDSFLVYTAAENLLSRSSAPLDRDLKFLHSALEADINDETLSSAVADIVRHGSAMMSIYQLLLDKSKSAEDASHLVDSFSQLSSNTNFRPSRFGPDAIDAFVAVVRYLTYRPKPIRSLLFAYYCRAVVNNPSIKPETIDLSFISKLNKIVKQSFAAIKRADTRPRIQPSIVDDRVDLASVLGTIIEHPKFKPELLDQIEEFTSKYGLRADLAVAALGGLATNPDMDLSKAIPRYLKDLVRLTDLIYRHNPRLYEGCFGVLKAILNSSYLTPKTLRRIVFAVSHAKEHSPIFLDFVFQAMVNPSIGPEKLTSQTLAKLVSWSMTISRKAGGVERLNMLLTQGKMRTSSVKDAYALMLYHSAAFLLRNPNLTVSDISTQTFRNLSEYSKAAIVSSALFGPSNLMAYAAIFRNPALKTRMIKPSLARWVSGALRDVVAQEPESRDLLLSKIGPPLTTNPELLRHFSAVAAKYAEAKKLARSLELDHKDPEICLSLAYALALLGREKTVALARTLNISYFLRYSTKTLNEVYANLDPKRKEGRPLLLVVFNKNDPNGAFYIEGQNLEKLTRYYRVVVSEAASDKGFRGRVSAISRTYGEIDTLIIGGHGQGPTINLGPAPNDEEERFLDLSDGSMISALSHCFKKNPSLVLISCLSGSIAGIGRPIAHLWNARLFAPTSASISTEFVLAHSGKIDDVRFYNISSSFVMQVVAPPTRK